MALPDMYCVCPLVLEEDRPYKLVVYDPLATRSARRRLPDSDSDPTAPTHASAARQRRCRRLKGSSKATIDRSGSLGDGLTNRLPLHNSPRTRHEMFRANDELSNVCAQVPRVGEGVMVFR